MSTLGKTNAEFELIKEGDRVLIALSGGKDSLTLSHALHEQRRRAPFEFELIAVTISYGMGENFDELLAHTKKHNITHHIYETKAYEIADEKIRKNSSFCSFFSRIRRGALYSAAEKYGCNKVALGHHLDDAIESFFMNFTYNGQLRSFAPKYRAARGVIVIRPLIQLRERQLAACAIENEFPTISDESCPSMRFDVKMPYARANTKKMLHEMEQTFPKLFVSLNAAFKNISTESFFDKRYFDI